MVAITNNLKGKIVEQKLDNEKTVDQSAINDQHLIPILLTLRQCNIIIDWCQHGAFDPCFDIVKTIHEQLTKIEINPSTDLNKKHQFDLPIYMCNQIVLTLQQAPYFVVAELIETVYSQGLVQIERLKTGKTDEKITVEQSNK